jgi:hypothetical protein
VTVRPDSDRNAPRFQIGDAVRVVSNARNQTLHAGHVRYAIWHFKDSCWNYYLEANGRKISKRYLAEDLEAVTQGLQR